MTSRKESDGRQGEKRGRVEEEKESSGTYGSEKEGVPVALNVSGQCSWYEQLYSTVARHVPCVLVTAAGTSCITTFNIFTDDALCIQKKTYYE